MSPSGSDAPQSPGSESIPADEESVVTDEADAPIAAWEEGMPPEEELAAVAEEPLAEDSGEEPLFPPETREWCLREAIMKGEGVETALAACFEGEVNGREILSAFGEETGWLAGLVKVENLMAELSGGSSRVTRQVIVEWANSGESGKLVKLADKLLDKDAATELDEARVRAIMASLLALLRPERAERLLDGALPFLQQSATDNEVAMEARAWVEAGALLNDAPLGERRFWNRRLRQPDAEWDWNEAEARMALRHLAQRAGDRLGEVELFKTIVPGCWWDLLEVKSEGSKAPSGVAEAPAMPVANEAPVKALLAPRLDAAGAANPRGGWLGFAAGTLFGCLLLLGVFAAWPWLPHGQSRVSPSGPPAAVELSVGQQVPDRPPEELAGSVQPELVVGPKAPEEPPPLQAWQTALIVPLRRDYPAVERLQFLLRDGSLEANERTLRGGSSVAPLGTPAHTALLEWLMIDPPADEDMGRAARRIYIQAADRARVVALLEKLNIPANPHRADARDCAQLLLDAGGTRLPAAMKSRLDAICAAK